VDFYSRKGPRHSEGNKTSLSHCLLSPRPGGGQSSARLSHTSREVDITVTKLLGQSQESRANDYQRAQAARGDSVSQATTVCLSAVTAKGKWSEWSLI
jgi:hypothetical protein